MEELKYLMTLIDKMRAKQQDIKEVEADLRDLKEELKELEQDQIPDLFMELELKALHLEDGSKVTVQDVYVPKVENEEAFFDWLESTGNDHLIKNTVAVDFAMKENSAAMALLDDLSRSGLNPKRTEKVHPSSLKKFVRELAEKGEFPPDSVSLTVIKKTNIKG